MCDRSSKEKEVYRQPVAIILMTPKRAAPARPGLVRGEGSPRLRANRYSPHSRQFILQL